MFFYCSAIICKSITTALEWTWKCACWPNVATSQVQSSYDDETCSENLPHNINLLSSYNRTWITWTQLEHDLDLELLPSGVIRMARIRIQHSCNYVINTNVKIWGRNDIKCYDASPSSCIKINTNYQRSFLHRNNEPRYASGHLSSGHQLLSSINNNIESTCSCKLKSSIPQIEIFQASMRTMLEPNG